MLDSMPLNKTVLGIEQSDLTGTISFIYSDASISFHDPMTLEEVRAKEDRTRLSNLQQAGFGFLPVNSGEPI